MFPDPDRITNGHGLLDTSLKFNSERAREMKGKHRSKTLIFKQCDHLEKTESCWELVCAFCWMHVVGRKLLSHEEEGASAALVQPPHYANVSPMCCQEIIFAFPVGSCEPK